MKIVTVEYRRLRTFGRYQNETVGAVAALGEGEQPSEALDALREWVEAQLGDDVERAGLQESVNKLRWRKDVLEQQIGRAEEKWAAIIAFMQKLGIERPADIPDSLEDLPF